MGSEAGRAAHDQLRAFVFELPTFGSGHTLAVPSFRHSVELQAVVTEHFGGLVVCGCQTNRPSYWISWPSWSCHFASPQIALCSCSTHSQRDRLGIGCSVSSASCSFCHERTHKEHRRSYCHRLFNLQLAFKFSKWGITQTFDICLSALSFVTLTAPLCSIFPLNLNVASS